MKRNLANALVKSFLNREPKRVAIDVSERPDSFKHTRNSDAQRKRHLRQISRKSRRRNRNS